MNKEDFMAWVNLNEQVFALARARMKTKRIKNVFKDGDDVWVAYLPEGALSQVPVLKRFELSEFVGE